MPIPPAAPVTRARLPLRSNRLVILWGESGEIVVFLRGSPSQDCRQYTGNCRGGTPAGGSRRSAPTVGCLQRERKLPGRCPRWWKVDSGWPSQGGLRRCLPGADQISSEFNGPVTFTDRSPDKRRVKELRVKTSSRAANSAVWRGDASACCASLESESGDKAIRLEVLSNEADPVFCTSVRNAVEDS